MSALVSISRVAKYFGGKRLLDVAALGLGKGELIVLSGDNGSGKSTFLKIVAGLEKADALALRCEGLEAGPTAYPRALRRLSERKAEDRRISASRCAHGDGTLPLRSRSSGVPGAGRPPGRQVCSRRSTSIPATPSMSSTSCAHGASSYAALGRTT